MAAGHRVGYKRVSTTDQTTARQLEDVQLDRCFEDKLFGKDTNRPQLEAMLKHVREGDTVIVHSLDRLGRNLDDLRKLVKELTGCGIRVEFVKESLTFTGEDSPVANLMLSMMGAFAEFERSLLLERQREGIQIAKAAGAYKGSKPKFGAEKIAEIRQRLEDGETQVALAKAYGISRMTLHSYLKAKATPATGRLKQ
jgi:DNA invertase Pin-like site-specific DNA recombinase